jgi:hypothetical protein
MRIAHRKDLGAVERCRAERHVLARCEGRRRGRVRDAEKRRLSRKDRAVRLERILVIAGQVVTVEQGASFRINEGQIDIRRFFHPQHELPGQPHLRRGQREIDQPRLDLIAKALASVEKLFLFCAHRLRLQGQIAVERSTSLFSGTAQGFGGRHARLARVGEAGDVGQRFAAERDDFAGFGNVHGEIGLEDLDAINLLLQRQVRQPVVAVLIAAGHLQDRDVLGVEPQQVFIVTQKAARDHFSIVLAGRTEQFVETPHAAGRLGERTPFHLHARMRPAQRIRQGAAAQGCAWLIVGLIVWGSQWNIDLSFRRIIERPLQVGTNVEIFFGLRRTLGRLERTPEVLAQ